MVQGAAVYGSNYDLASDLLKRVDALEGASGGGSSPAGVPVVRAFPFAFDTPGLVTGHTIYTPTIGDILLDAWVEIAEQWDGTTPKIDVGSFNGTAFGWFALNGQLVAEVVDNTNQFDSSLLVQGSGLGNPISLLSLAAINSNSNGATFGANQLRDLPAKFATANPIKVCVSTTGKTDGADPGATQGAGVLYLVTATPA